MTITGDQSLLREINRMAIVRAVQQGAGLSRADLANATRITSYNVCYTKLLRLRDSREGLSDAPEADQSERLSVEFGQWVEPVAEVDAFSPVAGAYVVGMASDAMAKFEEERGGELGDRLGAVGRDVADVDTFFTCSGYVDDVVAGSQQADEAHVRACSDDFPGQHVIPSYSIHYTKLYESAVRGG